MSAPSSDKADPVPLAHSAQGGSPVQTYAAHVASVTGVTWRAWRNAEQAGRYSTKFGTKLLRAVRLAGEFHDLGKLDPANQRVLAKPGSRESLPVKHWDAGVSALLRDEELRDPLAALLIFAHHKGLPNFEAERIRDSLAFREEEVVPGRPEPTCAYNDARLRKFLQRHRHALASEELPPTPSAVGTDGVPPFQARPSSSTRLTRRCPRSSGLKPSAGCSS